MPHYQAAGTMNTAFVAADETTSNKITRRTELLQVMQRSCRPTLLYSRELGGMNLALCQSSLKNWFSFLNFLLNTTK